MVLSNSHFMHFGKLSEISGSHGGKYEDDCLLGHCVVPEIDQNFRGTHLDDGGSKLL
jgi:hypothetical protein